MSTSVEKLKTRWSKCKRATVIGVGVASVMLPLAFSTLGVTLESIGQELQASFTDLQWVVNAYNLTFGAFPLAAGSLADLFGRRRMLAIGLTIFSLASLLCGLVQTPLMLILLEGLLGIGAAFVLSSGTAVLANEFRGRERAIAFGILGSCFGIGLAVGPIVGGILTSWLSWRWAFFVNVPVGLWVLLLLLPRMNESRDPSATRIDWIGLITFTASLFWFIFALIEGPHKGWGSPSIIGTFLGTCILLALFIFAELRQRRPMFDLALFRKPTFIAVSITPIAFAFGFVALLIYIPLYFQSIVGYSALQAGLLMIPLTLPLFAMPFVTSILTRYLQERVLISTGLALIGLGTLWMRAIEISEGWIDSIGSLLVIGIGAGILNGLMDRVAVSVVPPERSGMAAGIFSTTRVVGDSIAIAGAGAILISTIRAQLPALLTRTSVIDQSRMVELANLIARGDINGAASSIPSLYRDTFIQAANQSYTMALQTIFFVITCVSFATAILTLALVRTSDMVEEPILD